MRHYSRRTDEAYTAWIRRYILFHKKRRARIRCAVLDCGPTTAAPVADVSLGAGTALRRSQASKYDALRQYLEGECGDKVTLSFNAANNILGCPLPASAHRHQAFWANQTDTSRRPWAKAWQEAGYEVESYRLSEKDGWVRFRRRK